MDYTKIITIEPDKRSGKPCIRGMRMTVTDVLEYLAGGMTPQEIVDEFPDLTLEDIQACVENAQQLSLKVDRTALSVGALHDESDEKAFWLSKTPGERLAALELMRQIIYGYEYATAPRLQRVFTVAERSSG